jgi:hypothetical protein
MQQLNLSSGAGRSRDTLQGIFQGEDPTYSSTLGMVGNLAQVGLQSAGSRQAKRQAIADTLSAEMAKANMLAGLDERNAMIKEEEDALALQGKSQALIDYYSSVLNRMHPDDPRTAHVQAQLDALQAQLGGPNPMLSAYLEQGEQTGQFNPFAQAELGGVQPEETVGIPDANNHQSSTERPSAKISPYTDDGLDSDLND